MIWAVTGLIFFLKPGYKEAYESLQPRTYGFDNQIDITPGSDWLEFRYLRTILGNHLLARTANGWLHLDPNGMVERPPPDEEAVRQLCQDAFSSNPSRYGTVISVDRNRVLTDTGIRVTLDWNRLAFEQRGRDTDRIELFYRLHYLQWTGARRADQ